MAIVTSHWAENLTWLKKSKWPVILIDKEGAPASCFEPEFTIPNKGRECSSYFKYIIEHYSDLPEWVAFIHGHENAWHQMYNLPMLDLIDQAPKGPRTFQYLNGFWAGQPSEHYEEFWPVVEPWLGPQPEGATVCQWSAQFIVGRERITSRPKAFYESCYKFMMDTPNDFKFAVFMEYMYHYVWGESWVMLKKDFTTCDGTKVKIYNTYSKMEEIDLRIKHAISVLEPDHEREYKTIVARLDMESAIESLSRFREAAKMDEENLRSQGANDVDIRVWFANEKSKEYITLLQHALEMKRKVSTQFKEDIILEKILKLEKELNES